MAGPEQQRRGAARAGKGRKASAAIGSGLGKKVPGPTGAGSGKKAAPPTGGGLATVFEQHQLSAIDSLLRLLADPLASLLTWTVIAIALALPLSLLLLLQNIERLGSGLDQVSTLTLYLDPALTAADITELNASLEARPDIAAFSFISADQALVEFEASSGFGDALRGLSENPLPPVFLVTPAVADAEAVAALQGALAALPGVAEAQVDLQWLQRLGAIVALAARLAMLLAGLLGLGVILVIGNTIRLAIENRRAEIVVTKLVGGTDAYVARPFLYTGLWYGVGGGLLAVLLIALVLFGLRGPFNALVGAYSSDFSLGGLGLTNAFLVLVAAGLLGWLGAWVSVVRHLRAIEPR